MTITLRRHQAKAQEIGEAIHAGDRNEKVITASVTPGGGKSLMGSLVAHPLLKRDCARVLVVCPRVTLMGQMRDGFTVPEIGLRGGLRVGYAHTRSLLRDELAGYITTYQDVVTSPAKWLRLVQDVPTLVVFDEAHHLPAGWAESSEETGFTAACRPLHDAAKRVLCMTGSPARADKAPLAFVEYVERKPTWHIRYTRRDALDERAIINVDVKMCDGDAAYWHRFSEHRHTLSTVSTEESSRALRALLESDEYRNKMLSMACEDFARYRDTRNPNARMIIVCANQPQARSVAGFLREAHYRPVLAISDEADAHRNLARFRKQKHGDVLVTCAMAHEGLDVPECTHLVALTHIRSRPWLEQALSRVTRFDPKCGLAWDEQVAQIYVPIDPDMVSFVAEWIDEQDDAHGAEPARRSGVGPIVRSGTFRPESGELTGVRYADTFGIYSEADQLRIIAMRRLFPGTQSLTTSQTLDIARAMWPDDAAIPAERGAA